ncbi:hypothetical protein FOL46_000804 [Perkinsus olseni]|uniref:Uncharacterized protein n=1 Tax=Perkinsus olseni TaxID=32597 RepID=A0A7J6MVP0_PEROL|nr:hypothetical protein FOL46_000804 [Perkinsus olseni]
MGQMTDEVVCGTEASPDEQLKVLSTNPCLGGLRSPHLSTIWLPHGIILFKRIKERFESILSKDGVADALLYGEDPLACPLVVTAIDEASAALLAITDCSASEGKPSHEHSPVKGFLLQRLVSLCGDWDVDVPRWFIEGAPVGLSKEIDYCNIFPRSGRPELEPDGSDRNYPSTYEHYDEVLKVLKAEEERGFCKLCSTFEEVKTLVHGDDIVLTPLAALPKSNGKLRLVSDCKVNHLNDYCFVDEHVELPRVFDLIEGIVQLLNSANDHGEFVEVAVIDFADAVRTIPLAVEERPFHVLRVGGYYVVFFCLFYGLSSSPLLWGRTAALLSRLGQLFFVTSTNVPLGRIETFVDDPAMCARGPTIQVARRRLWLPVLLWLALGFRLSFGKRQVSLPVRWIGFMISKKDMNVVVTLPLEKLRVILEMVRPLLVGKARIATKKLRSLCGRLSFAGQIVPYLRAFVALLWSRLARADASNQQWITVGDLVTPLKWIWCFLSKAVAKDMSNTGDGADNYLRYFPVERLHVVRWCICVDASPTGLGGFLRKGEEIVSWFADPLDECDCLKFGAVIGDCRWQSVWELLAVLVAIRLWSSRIPSNVRVMCESDSVVALSAASRLRSKSPSLNCIAQELALHCAVVGVWYQIKFGHVAGVRNQIADDLSRLKEGRQVPSCLEGVSRTKCDKRDGSFWLVP